MSRRNLHIVEKSSLAKMSLCLNEKRATIWLLSIAKCYQSLNVRI